MTHDIVVLSISMSLWCNFGEIFAVNIYCIATHDIILFLHVFIRISFKFLFICVVRYVLSNYSFCLM